MVCISSPSPPKHIPDVSPKSRVHSRLRVRSYQTPTVNHCNLIRVKLDHTIHNSSTNFIKVIFWNARSLNNKTQAIYDFLSSGKCDFLAVAETWFTDDDCESRNLVTLSEMLPDNFQLIHIPRPDGREGGGVGLIYNMCVKVRFERLSINTKYKQFESMTLLAHFVNCTICISVVYRPQPTKKNKLKLISFCTEWVDFLSWHNEKT